MRHPGEILAMLAEHGISLTHIPGGMPELVALDVAAALGMMHDTPGAAMLLAKYTLDPRATDEFRNHWRMAVDRHAYSERWSIDNRQIMLADYSLAEWLDAQRCKTCRGVGTQITASGKVERCPVCEGTGLRRIGLRQPARALGMSAEGYRKSAWVNRMEWARRELIKRELTALQDFALRLTNGRSKGNVK
jgi:hypothetical protein